MSDSFAGDSGGDFRLSSPGSLGLGARTSASASASTGTSTSTSTGTSEPATFSVFRGDAVEWLSSFEDASVDLVVTDPAYESLEKYRAIGTTTRLRHSKSSSNDWFQIFPNARFPELFREIHRVLRKDSHFYLFCDAETMFVAKPLAEAAGFRFWKPIVWSKCRIGMGYHYRASYELILFFEKGKRKLNDLSVSDVITCTSIRGGYPAEKPAAVSQVLIRQSSSPGELVIDPFTGSGSVGVAGSRLGRHFLGNDVCAEATEIAKQRVAEAGARLDRQRYDAARR